MTEPPGEAVGVTPMSTKRVAFMVGALLMAVMTCQLSATMLAPAIREIETTLGTGSFAAMSTARIRVFSCHCGFA